MKTSENLHTQSKFCASWQVTGTRTLCVTIAVRAFTAMPCIWRTCCHTSQVLCAEHDASTEELLLALLPALETYNTEAAARLWPLLCAACARCLACTLAAHSVHCSLQQQGCSLADGLIVERAASVQQALQQACATMQAAQAAVQLDSAVLHALLEALLFHGLLRDAGALGLLPVVQAQPSVLLIRVASCMRHERQATGF